MSTTRLLVALAFGILIGIGVGIGSSITYIEVQKSLPKEIYIDEPLRTIDYEWRDMRDRTGKRIAVVEQREDGRWFVKFNNRYYACPATPEPNAQQIVDCVTDELEKRSHGYRFSQGKDRLDADADRSEWRRLTQ